MIPVVLLFRGDDDAELADNVVDVLPALEDDERDVALVGVAT